MNFIFTDGDFEAADVLLTLDIIRESVAERGFTLTWATKKPRSLRRRSKLLSPKSVTRSPSSSFQKDNVAISPTVDARQKSHSNKLPVNGHYLKRKRERLLETMDELTRENKTLGMEKENFHLTLLKLKTENLQLKAQRQHMLSSGGKFLRNLPAGDKADGRDQPSVATVHCQPSILHPTVHIQGRTEGLSMYPYSQSFPLRSQPGTGSRTYHEGDVAIGQPIDDFSLAKSTAAALARQRRKQIYKSKGSPKNSLSHSSPHKLIFVARYI